MEPVVVSAGLYATHSGEPVISSTITAEGKPHDIYIRSANGPLSRNADPFATVALLVAMKLGAPLHIQGNVSPRLLAHLPQIQDILCVWYKDVHHVPVQAGVSSPDSMPAGPAVASFFSGGVDSFYTALKRPAEIQSLIFVHGFDVPLQAAELRALIGGANRKAAAELGKPLVEVETNLRQLVDPYVNWGTHSHGAALAAVAQALAPQYSTVYINSTYDYARLRPSGSHPLLDPLWSPDGLEIVHDGCERHRWDKALAIIGNETVQRYLRVCWEYPRTEYNCGRCLGCYYVRIFLRAAGMSERCRTFPPLVDAGEVARLPMQAPGARSFMWELLALAEQRGTDGELIAALRTWAGKPALKREPAEETPELLWAYGRIAQLEKDPAAHAAAAHEIQQAIQRAADLERRLGIVLGSHSWRLTAPLRDLVAVLRGMGRKGRE